MDRKGKIELTESEKKAAIIMYRSGNYMAKEICDRFGIYHKDLRKMVEEAGYGY